jgi:hypothetical protein
MTDATKLEGKCLCGAVRARIALPEPQSNTVIDDAWPLRQSASDSLDRRDADPRPRIEL